MQPHIGEFHIQLQSDLADAIEHAACMPGIHNSHVIYVFMCILAGSLGNVLPSHNKLSPKGFRKYYG